MSEVAATACALSRVIFLFVRSGVKYYILKIGAKDCTHLRQCPIVKVRLARHEGRAIFSLWFLSLVLDIFLLVLRFGFVVGRHYPDAVDQPALSARELPAALLLLPRALVARPQPSRRGLQRPHRRLRPCEDVRISFLRYVFVS